jgi:hypothetical protein
MRAEHLPVAAFAALAQRLPVAAAPATSASS